MYCSSNWSQLRLVARDLPVDRDCLRRAHQAEGGFFALRAAAAVRCAVASAALARCCICRSLCHLRFEPLVIVAVRAGQQADVLLLERRQPLLRLVSLARSPLSCDCRKRCATPASVRFMPRLPSMNVSSSDRTTPCATFGIVVLERNDEGVASCAGPLGRSSVMLRRQRVDDRLPAPWRLRVEQQVVLLRDFFQVRVGSASPPASCPPGS